MAKAQASFETKTCNGVTLNGGFHRADGVTFAFTERNGGVSAAPFASLNLGDAVGDDPGCVTENRHRVLCAMGAQAAEKNLVVPKQVHGDHLVEITSNAPEAICAARVEARAGADGILCTAVDVPVLLCFADCVPVVLCVQDGFAVVHSGWKGTFASIAAKAAVRLCELKGYTTSQVEAFIGPHIAGCDYEVSEELLNRFETSFGSMVKVDDRHLSLAAAIEQSLTSAGVMPCNIHNIGISTPAHTDRFFSYRKERGLCGRHGAVAWMVPATPLSQGC